MSLKMKMRMIEGVGTEEAGMLRVTVLNNQQYDREDDTDDTDEQLIMIDIQLAANLP